MAKFVFTIEDRDGGIDFEAEKDEAPIPENDKDLSPAQALAAQILTLVECMYQPVPAPTDGADVPTEG